MWVRGRTVLALAVLAAIAGGAATWGAVQAGGLTPTAIMPVTSVKGIDSPDGLRQEELDKLNKALDLIGDHYMVPADRRALIDGALQGMVESLGDPYSVYMSSEEAGKFTDTTQGAFTGIGADLKKENGMIVVDSPMKDSPAERAGLQARDVLLMVNGESLQGLSLSDAAAKIRGPKGTKAKLKVLRSGAKEPIELELVRDRIPMETVKAQLGEDGIGRLSISQFSMNTPVQVEDELKAMETKGMKALVVDLRNDPGGMTDSVEKIASLLVPAGKVIVQYEYNDGHRVQALSQAKPDQAKTYPILVLINKASASSAEILAGALRQSAGAVLVGETSFGKGTVQISYGDDLGDGSLLKLTVFKWLLPDGTWIHHQGIEPDLKVAQPDYWLAFKLPRDRVLKRDETGEDVKNLQNILEGVGFPADRKDGYFSEATEQALRSFQQQEGLTVTGTVDEKTADRLEEALYGELQKPENDKQLQAALDKARSMIGLTSAGRNFSPSVEYVGG
ncbi:S41 family peptidase [Cohnella candidum]|uniref:S41 family peptidase n=1 Tax=Cohnella candidum TaxID=2674991 RepID=UPI001F156828|nr:S41 family peptidase [Cohnella candidum]